MSLLTSRVSPGLMSLVASTQLPTPALITILKGRHAPAPPPSCWCRRRWAGLQERTCTGVTSADL